MAFDQNDLFKFKDRGDQVSQLLRLPEVEIEGHKLQTTPVFDAYWYFAFERQNMFRKRVFGSNDEAVTKDPTLAGHRFTNAYRASDRVSQFLIGNVIWVDDHLSTDEIFFRILLFKIFNRIETWDALTQEFGSISLDTYDFSRFNDFLSDRQKRGVRNYSAAYIMPSAGTAFGYASKHANHLMLLEWMLEKRFPERFVSSDTMAEAYHLLLTAPSIGPFLAYQFATDLNYSSLSQFSEMEFVVAGPGALDGISKCFTDTKRLPPALIIQHLAEHQNEFFSYYGLEFSDLWGRPLQLIDCQNLFCEISKYSREAFPSVPGLSGRTRIKQKFKLGGRLPRPWYPPNWGVNDRIAAEISNKQCA